MKSFQGSFRARKLGICVISFNVVVLAEIDFVDEEFERSTESGCNAFEGVASIEVGVPHLVNICIRHVRVFTMPFADDVRIQCPVSFKAYVVYLRSLI